MAAVGGAGVDSVIGGPVADAEPTGSMSGVAGVDSAEDDGVGASDGGELDAEVTGAGEVGARGDSISVSGRDTAASVSSA